MDGTTASAVTQAPSRAPGPAYCVSQSARCGVTVACNGMVISTVAECQQAAAAVGMSSPTATLSSTTTEPRGCYQYKVSTLLNVRTLRFNSVGTESSTLTNAWAICRLGGKHFHSLPV